MRTQVSDTTAEMIARAARCKAKNVCFISLRPLEGQVTVTMDHGAVGKVTVLAKFYDGPVTSA